MFMHPFYHARGGCSNHLQRAFFDIGYLFVHCWSKLRERCHTQLQRGVLQEQWRSFVHLRRR